LLPPLLLSLSLSLSLALSSRPCRLLPAGARPSGACWSSPLALGLRFSPRRLLQPLAALGVGALGARASCKRSAGHSAPRPWPSCAGVHNSGGLSANVQQLVG
ncbi:hypothetical protein Taro_048184, partial [Colocasia esculenta]|nr:hypothetical protein [Colocasia esculenta]